MTVRATACGGSPTRRRSRRAPSGSRRARSSSPTVTIATRRRYAAATTALPFPTSTPAVLRALDVTALHQVVLGGMLGLPISERGGTPGLTYTQDATAALAAVERGGAAAAFFVPRTSLAALRAVSLAGLTMPEKSTYFHPKLLTGLVIYPLDGGG